MSNRVLITGGAGFIGSHTADQLHEKGYKIRILDNLSPKTHSGGWPKYLNKDYELIKGDVRHINHWRKALTGVDYVVHLAGWMDMLPEFSQFAKVNMLGTANLYEVIVANNLPIKKVVVASSQFVYGEGKWWCKIHGKVFPGNRKEENLIKKVWDPVCPKPNCSRKIAYKESKETHLPHPPNQYAISKLTQEKMAMILGKLYHIPSVAMRYSIAHGPRQTIKSVYSGALRIFTLQLLSGLTPTIYEDGKQLRDYVDVRDIASANVSVLESEKADYNIFNVGSGKGYTINELVEIISKKLNKKPIIKPNGMYRTGDNRHSVSDISKLKSIGWVPKYSEEDAVEGFIDWVMSQNIKANTSTTNSKMVKMGVIRHSL